MPGDVAETFMKSLQEAERTKDVEPLVRLFADDAEVETPMLHRSHRGRDGARAFWKEYLGAFGSVRSEFTDTRRADGFASLEWKSDGTLPDGRPVSYRGVSLLDTDGQKVRRFRTYYDSAVFLSEGAKHAR